MFNIAGHEIVLGGGPYLYDQDDPQVMVHCIKCPDGAEKGWGLWKDRNETGRPVPPQVGVEVVVAHLRADGMEVPDELSRGAELIAVLQDNVLEGYLMLREHFDPGD